MTTKTKKIIGLSRDEFHRAIERGLNLPAESMESFDYPSGSSDYVHISLKPEPIKYDVYISLKPEPIKSGNEPEVKGEK